MTLEAAAEESRWGFCPDCSRWRLSDAWLADGGPRAACPVCGQEPDPLEVVVDGTGRVLLVLELPPGTEMPLLT